MNVWRDIIERNKVWYCMDCGKCSAVCPITRRETRDYASPRLLVEKAVSARTDDFLDAALFWSCLTCKRCSELCPADVFFSEFIRDARGIARQRGRSGPCTHGEVIQTWGRIMADPKLSQNRLGWLNDELAVSDDGDTVFFVGCLPHYDRLFQDLHIEGVQIARAAIKILNSLGIAPQVMADERCCGHDQLWQGDVETFRKLARLNLKGLDATGAKRIVTTCPECARTLSLDYPKLVGSHGMQVLHLSQFLASAAVDGKLNCLPAARSVAVTFQDPCRLGRHLGVYEEPRRVLEALGFQLIEMEPSRAAGLCCGTSGWTACGQVSKSIQAERLRQAQATGADLLVTACIKCQIHFKCARRDPELEQGTGIEIRDMTTLIADRLAESNSDTAAIDKMKP
jgi:heterodisulfide reductase subunit D